MRRLPPYKTAGALCGALTPDWRHAQFLRLPGGSLLIIPAIFAPSVAGGLATMGTTGSSRTLTNFVMGGTGTLIALIHTFHTSTARTITSATFNGVGMTLGQSNNLEDSPENLFLQLAYLHEADVTTANVVANFSASATNSGVAAYWVTELVNQTAEAGNGGNNDGGDVTFSTTTITDNAFIASGGAAWSDGSVDPSSPWVKVVQSSVVSNHYVAAGYRIAGAAGAYSVTWAADGDGDETQAVANAFAVSAGGGGSVFVPLARRRLSLICR
jgi:hypothetical protein